MAPDDSDPHRRNLVVTSLAFIAFQVGGARIPDCSDADPSCGDAHLRLAFLNVELTNLGWLYALAVVALFWFGFRYKQKCPGAARKLSNSLRGSVTKCCYWKPLVVHQKDDQEMRFAPVARHPVTFFNIEASLSKGKPGSVSRQRREGDPYSTGVIPEENLESLSETLKERLTPTQGYVVESGLKSRWDTMWNGSVFADWVVPWLLFWWAAGIAMWNAGEMLAAHVGWV